MTAGGRRRLLLGLAGLVAAGAAYSLWGRGGGLPGLPLVGGISGSRPAGGGTVTAEVGSIAQIVVATGRVEAVTEVTLANKIPGRIKALLVKEGDPVALGQPVILFDDQEYVAQRRMAEAKVASAQAEVARARRTLEAARATWAEVKSGARSQEIKRARAELDEARGKAQFAAQERERNRQLFAGGYIARSQYEAAVTDAEVAAARVRIAEETLDLLLAGPKPETVEAGWARVQEVEAELRRAESQVVQARAELEYAGANLKTTVIDSTVSGKVIRKLVEPGEAVDIGIPLMVLGDVSQVIVKTEVDETDVGKLALGQAAEIRVDAYPGRAFPGRIIEIGQAVGRRKIRPEDPTRIQDMKVLETKIEVTAGGADLKLGLTADVTIKSAREGVVVIPGSLVPAGSREATVQVLSGTGVESRRITLGMRDAANVEVVSGLRPGERLVATGRR